MSIPLRAPEVGICSLVLSVMACAARPPATAPADAPRAEALADGDTAAAAETTESTAGAAGEYRQRLERQLRAHWGWRNDKDDQIHAPLLDWRRWNRIRYWGIPHLTGFRYGQGHKVLTIALTVDLPEATEPTAQACMSTFEAWARPRARKYDVVLGPMRTKRGTWNKERLLIKWVDGHVDFAFQRRKFSAAWAAYPAYQRACLVYAVSVQWDGEADFARQVRDRFVNEGFERMLTLTDVPPTRK